MVSFDSTSDAGHAITCRLSSEASQAAKPVASRFGFLEHFQT